MFVQASHSVAINSETCKGCVESAKVTFILTFESDDLQALDWIEEVDILYQHAHYTIEIQLREHPSHIHLHWAELCSAWRVFDCPDSPAFYETRTIAYILAADIFFKLGNTAAAAHRRVAAFTQYATRKDYPDGANLELIVDFKECFKMTELRHPDPSLVSKLQVVDAALSVRGSWNKLPCPKSGRLHAGSRLGFSSFIWKGSPALFLRRHALTCSHRMHVHWRRHEEQRPS